MRIPPNLTVPTVGDLMDFARMCGCGDAGVVLTAAMKILERSDWPDGDEAISKEHAVAVLLELGFSHEPTADTAPASIEPDPKAIPPDLHLKDVGALIDYVGHNPDSAINGMVTILNAAMAEMESDGWPDGEDPLTPEQGMAILLRLGYRRAPEKQ